MTHQNLLNQHSRLQQQNKELFNSIEPWQLLSNNKDIYSSSLLTESIQSEQPTRHIAILIDSHLCANEHNEVLKDLLKNTGDVRTIYPYLVSGLLIISYYSLKDAKYGLEIIMHSKLMNAFKVAYYVKPCTINKKMNEKLFVVLSTTNEFIDLKQFNYMTYLQQMGLITSTSEVNISSKCTIINLEYDDERSNEKILKQLNHAIIENICFNVYTNTKNDPCSCSYHSPTTTSLVYHHPPPPSPSPLSMPWEDRLPFINTGKAITSNSIHSCSPTISSQSYFSTDPFPPYKKSLSTNTSYMTSSLLPPSPPLLYHQKKKCIEEEEEENNVKFKMEEEPYSFSTTTMMATTTNSTVSSHSTTSSCNNTNTKNDIDFDKIIQGEDKRTTFMIRNIPNKYTQQMLIDCINSSHANTYDFLYLRIDFKNKCNVGYAFINFIDPKSVILFAKEKAGKKWEHFNSDKRCALSYANIQGKDALIKKFKNSQVMFEDAAYRPKIFYSDGPNKGKEQAFPVPSDLKNLEENTYVLKESRHLNNSNHHRRRQHHHRRS